MKPSRVQRNVRPSTRTPGDAPTIGRVTKLMDRGERLAGAGPQRHGQKKPVNILTKGWLIGVGVLAMGVLIAVIGIWTLGRAKPSPSQAGPRLVEGIRAPSPDIELRLNPEEALSIARQAVSARTEREVEAHCFPGNTAIDEVLRYLSETTAAASEGEFQLLQTMDTNGLPMQNVLVTYPDVSGNSTNRLVMLTPDVEGVWKMDFAAFARLAEPSWEDFLAARSDSIVLRVFVEKDTYYNGMFSDERRWVCFGMVSPELPDLLMGYCEHGTPVAKALYSLLRQAGGSPVLRVTLELQRVEGAEARQFIISRILAEDWVVREPYFDERFE